MKHTLLLLVNKNLALDMFRFRKMRSNVVPNFGKIVLWLISVVCESRRSSEEFWDGVRRKVEPPSTELICIWFRGWQCVSKSSICFACVPSMLCPTQPAGPGRPFQNSNCGLSSSFFFGGSRSYLYCRVSSFSSLQNLCPYLWHEPTSALKGRSERNTFSGLRIQCAD